jgi:5-hydroxyisourate hydrolase-like protein (transthyretin family)
VSADFDGAPLEFIDVCAYEYDGLYWQGAGCGSTDAAGFYDIGGLAAGDYRVLFSDNDNGYYLSEYYDDAPDIESAVNVAVTAGSITTAIDAALAEPGHIAGKVTVYPSGVPLEAVEVCAFTNDGSDWVDAGCDVTDASGDYDIASLSPGAYRVSFSDLFQFYVREFYDDVLEIENGTDVSVTSGSTTLGINAALIEGGQITGTVTAEGGSLLQDIAACAYRYNGAAWLWVGCGYSEAGGDYTISGLAGGTYRVEFYDWYDGVYHGEFYDNAPDLDSAADVTVSAGSTTTGIHAALIEFGHIGGTVTAEFGGAPLSNIEVCAYVFNGTNWEWLNCVTSDANGDYDVGGLDSGIYRLGFTDYGGDYLSEFYDNAPDVNSAADINVTLGSTTSGINAALRDYGHITGSVTDESSGAPLADVRVCSYSYEVSHWRAGKCAFTDANGVYDIGGLTAADYRLGFFDSTGNYRFEYYNNSPDINSAVNLSVADDATLSGINGALSGQVPSPPLNDDIDSALAAQGFPYQNVLDVRHATTAVDDPVFTCQPKDQGYGSVWYAVTPDQASILRANTFGSNYDTVLGIWEGTRGSLSSLSCNDTALGTQSQTTAGPLAGGVTYYVEVAGYDSELIELVLNLDLVPDTPFADCVSDTGSSASFNIPANVTVDGTLTLTPGDEFALFTPDGSVCAGHGTWTGSDLSITAWGDDSQTQEVDGFAEGDEIKILIWDFSSDKFYIVTNVFYSFTTHGADTYKAGESFFVASLAVAPRVTQRIALSSGWNMISSYVDPEYPDLELVMAGVESKMVLMKNGAGEVYWPQNSVNNIGEWNVRDGYQIYMDGSATLRVTGAAVEPDQMPISLPAGWSLIAYLRAAPQPADQALSSISGQLVLAKNGDGEIYWPAFNVNQIGDMQPGAGYKVYLSDNGTLMYPAND